MRGRGKSLLAVDFDPRLVEEVVFRAVQGKVSGIRFRLERDRLYGIEDPDSRDEAFQKLHRRWFQSLEFDRPFFLALEERPLIARSVQGLVVAPSLSRREESAELFVSPEEERFSDETDRSVGIQVLPETVLDRDAILVFLRHELLHISDMVDPDFGYEPNLPPSPAGPVHDGLIRDRYRVLWDCTIDGRLTAAGTAQAGIRAARRREFHAAFPMLGPATDERFDLLFEGTMPRHAELAELAVHSGQPGGKGSPDCCSLCRFPDRSLLTGSEDLSDLVVERVRIDFPRWDSADGICFQCAELYRSRPMSAAAASLLPHPD